MSGNYIYRVALRIFVIIMAVGALSLSSGCQRKSNGEAEFPPLEFAVDLSLLSPPQIIDGAFSMRFPGDWDALGDTAFATLQAIIEQDTTSYFKLRVLRVQQSEIGSTCAISKIIGEAAPFARLDADYDSLLKESYRAEQVARGAFSINRAGIVQYRIIRQDEILFKLFAHIGNRYYQIDFSIPQSVYQAEIMKVESSLGSLHPI
jgi:hypothetical protein